MVGNQARDPRRSALVLESLAGTDLWSYSVEVGPLPPAARESVNLLREPDAANPHVRFDEREVETERLRPPRHLSTLQLIRGRLSFPMWGHTRWRSTCQ